MVESGLTQTDEIGRGRIREQSSGETGDEGLMLSLLAAWSLRSVCGSQSASRVSEIFEAEGGNSRLSFDRGVNHEWLALISTKSGIDSIMKMFFACIHKCTLKYNSHTM